MDKSLYIQDTTGTRLVIRIDAGGLLPDSVFRKMDETPGYLKAVDSSLVQKKIKAPERVVINDTISTCTRNAVADITFHQPGIIKNLRYIPAGRVRYDQENDYKLHEHKAANTILISSLKEGERFPLNSLHSDVVIVIIFIAAFLFLYARSSMRNFVSDLRRFFLFRGINESSSRDIGSLFNWQSTLLNFISFLITALFAFSSMAYFGLKPEGIYPSLFILVMFAIIVFGITMRHLMCVTTGNLSGNSDVFNEYLVNVYQSYRFSSIILFALILLMNYTVLLPAKHCIIAGLAVLSVIYFFRITRLLLIFIRRDISILYLILYLCALEILPVLIIIKYLQASD